ncbi:MAG: LLM class F420-dependent oxidoreductase [Alphaproteobacteria bacterium]
MKVGLVINYSGAGFALPDAEIAAAEQLGFDSVWTSEAWGSDAVTPAAWTLSRTKTLKVGTAIMQMQARTPAMAAMTAMTLNALSGGRFIMGIGPSGPQVIEGWHGVPYGKPLMRTREYIQIVRQILERKGPLEHSGEHYQIPYHGEGATGLGKPLKSILHGDASMKIYTGTIAPAGVATSAEVADGMFPVFAIPEKFDVFAPALEKGFAKAGGGKGLEHYDILPFVPTVMGDDLAACRQPVKENLALYIGGMGARDKNFYNDYAKRLGYETAAKQIQDLFLTGRRVEAAAAVPDELVDAIALVGSAKQIEARVQDWKKAAGEGLVHSMVLSKPSIEAMEIVAKATRL